VLEAVQLPAGIADLHASLPDVDRETFTLKQNCSSPTIAAQYQALAI
jgi:hypothetical protein